MEWIKIDHAKKSRSHTKPPVKELVLLGYNNGKDSWVVAGHREQNGTYWNQFQDKYTDAQIYPTHFMPLPEPPQE